MRVLSLFSGIGAFEKALSNLNIKYELVNYCEIDKFASMAYSTIHDVDEKLNLGDIRSVDIGYLPNDIDLLTHGSPCQDFSVAGYGRGADGNTRSSLMWNSVEIIKHCRPKVVIWENVKNVLSVKHRHNFEKYLDELEKVGYKNYHQVLNAKHYGIPQNRERIFVISILDNRHFKFPEPFERNITLRDMLEKSVDEKFFISPKKYQSILNSNFNQERHRIQKKDLCATLLASDFSSPKCVYENIKIKVNEETKKRYTIATPEDAINIERPASKTRRARVGKEVVHTITITPQQGILDVDYRVRKLIPLEYWRLMGFSDEDFWKVKSIGMSNTQLYKQAGNSIVVNVLMEIYKNLFF